jgi:hypothetical protein
MDKQETEYFISFLSYASFYTQKAAIAAVYKTKSRRYYFTGNEYLF